MKCTNKVHSILKAGTHFSASYKYFMPRAEFVFNMILYLKYKGLWKGFLFNK